MFKDAIRISLLVKDASHIKRIVESNPLLESFGNAQTAPALVSGMLLVWVLHGSGFAC